jgi:hypothetical protein
MFKLGANDSSEFEPALFEPTLFEPALDYWHVHSAYSAQILEEPASIEPFRRHSSDLRRRGFRTDSFL